MQIHLARINVILIGDCSLKEIVPEFVRHLRDSELSESGIAQAKDLAGRLKQDLPPEIDLIVVSPMSRCLQTYLYAPPRGLYACVPINRPRYMPACTFPQL